MQDAWVEAWRRDWSALGAIDADMAVLMQLADAYAQPHRHYHTLQHLQECLALLDSHATQAAHAAELRIALWFHDAVYDTHCHDNEQRSADWARSALLAAGVPLEAASRVHALVMATRHAAPATTADEALLLDIDLAILGADTARFDEYERQVRAEYAWVPEVMFRHSRRALLQGFLDRETVFLTLAFTQRYEMPARANLQRAIVRLA